MSAAASVEVRTGVIAFVKADAGVKATALGASPRIYNRAPPEGDPRAKFPFLVVSCSERPFDTSTEWGALLDLEVRVMGEYEGDAEGEAIQRACRVALRDWAPAPFSTHAVRNVVFQFGDVAADESGKRYAGLQRWRVVTEEN